MLDAKSRNQTLCSSVTNLKIQIKTRDGGVYGTEPFVCVKIPEVIYQDFPARPIQRTESQVHVLNLQMAPHRQFMPHSQDFNKCGLKCQKNDQDKQKVLADIPLYSLSAQKS